MRKPKPPALFAVLVGAFVLGCVAVALAAGGVLGGGEGSEVDVQPSPATASGLPASVGGGPAPGAGGGSRPAPAGPDTPVSSDDTPPPSPTAVADPPAAFSGIRSFEDCAAAGYPVMESYPEQCRTPDGRLFVRVID